MRRLIAILMMLWLPLQAIAGIVAPACERLHLAHSAIAASPDSADAHGGMAHAHHAAVQGGAHTDLGAPSDGVNDLDAQSGPQCADCLMACGACVQVQTVTNLRLDLGAVPAAHGAEAFASVAANRALEPPIAAA